MPSVRRKHATSSVRLNDKAAWASDDLISALPSHSSNRNSVSGSSIASAASRPVSTSSNVSDNFELNTEADINAVANLTATIDECDENGEEEEEGSVTV